MPLVWHKTAFDDEATILELGISVEHPFIANTTKSIMTQNGSTC